MKLTFLSHFNPMAKTFSKEGVSAYPPAKRFTSFEYEIPLTAEGLREKFLRVQEHSRAADVMLKGNLTKTIRNQSRANLSDKSNPSYNLVLDIDGVRFLGAPTAPINHEQLKSFAETIIEKLPAPFHGVSYIVHASSSMGLKPGVLSMHLDFLLDEPLTEEQQKHVLTALNFDVPVFEQQLELTASGTALRYKVDRTLGEASRLIYIAPPIFEEGVDNPFEDNEQRLLLVEKTRTLLPTANLLDSFRARSYLKHIKDKVTALREHLGLPSHNTKVQQVKRNGQNIAVVLNPDAVQMEYSYHNESFVYYNINGGDSNAYFVFRDDPQIVHNFKGEPNFLFQQADEETYAWHIDKFGYCAEPDPETEGETPPKMLPFVFRDVITDTTYTCLINTKDQTVDEMFAVRGRDSLRDWMTQNNGVMPENIPSLTYKFDPTNPKVIDLQNNFINRYEPTAHLRELAEIPEQYRGAEYGYGVLLKELCPTIYKIGLSICGGGALEFEHFINWLAYIAQNKNKTRTAWVMHGVQGTGKGVFFHEILAPLFGKRHALMKSVQDIEEHFNLWFASTLILGLDEFSSDDSRSKKLVTNKLKNLITEPLLTIRAMRTDQATVENFANFIFFSNDKIPVYIPEGDRRFNVCPAQQTKLNKRYPDIDKLIREELPKEVPLFGSFLMQFKVAPLQAHSALENGAKDIMRNAGRSSVEEFCDNLKTGNLDAFLEVLSERQSPALNDPIKPAQDIVLSWVRRIKADETPTLLVSTSDLRIVYNATTGRVDNERTFGKLLSRRDVLVEKKRLNGLPQRVVTVKWNIEELDLTTLLREFDGAPIPNTSTRPPELVQ